MALLPRTNANHATECAVNKKQIQRLSLVALLASSATISNAQAPAAAPPTPTIWRFMGIPQGIQKIRDVTVNRHGNFPGLERKPPVKRIGDPANLESDNPAIKAAAEIKQAEDLKMQKIKAIKFLASMGCGCYDKEGKITKALLAAMDDCTPDVRLAAIEAIGDTANGECCKSCGSTSCCSEAVTKRLSEIAYERDDSGCMLEPSAEVRDAAKKALCACCPNRATGPIEEDVPEQLPEVPVPIQGETEDDDEEEAIEGEGSGVEMQLESETTVLGGNGKTYVLNPSSDQDELISPSHYPASTDESRESSSQSLRPMPMILDSAQQKTSNPSVSSAVAVNQTPTTNADSAAKGVEVGTVRMIGGMAIRPVTISPVSAIENEVEFSLDDAPAAASSAVEPQAPKLAPRPRPVALPIKPQAVSVPESPTQQQSVSPKQSQALVVGVDHRTGKVALRSGQPLRVGASVTVYHSYLTGERLVGHLLIQSVRGSQAVAVATDRSGLEHMESGDRAVCF
ncbi:hypothetical protein C2E31_15100 [Rhodopirellula baltica]|nr:hypothetical protein C2E31_15100 [Rhodopirellula baltica]